MKFVAITHLVICFLLCLAWGGSYIYGMGCLIGGPTRFCLFTSQGDIFLFLYGDVPANAVNFHYWDSKGTKDSLIAMENTKPPQNEMNVSEFLGFEYSQWEYFNSIKEVKIPYWMLVSCFAIYPTICLYRRRKDSIDVASKQTP